MKKIFLFLLLCQSILVYAQDTTAKMPPEETKPTSYWWWVLGVVITLAIGMVVYRMLKKDPRKDG